MHRPDASNMLQPKHSQRREAEYAKLRKEVLLSLLIKILNY